MSNRSYKKELKLRKKKLINYVNNYYREYNGEEAFLNINRILLENYLEYYSLENNVIQSDDTRNEIIEQLKKALTILTRIDMDNYNAKAITYSKEHTTKYLFLINPKTKEEVILGEGDLLNRKLIYDYIKEHPETKSWMQGINTIWNSEEDKNIYKKLYEEAEKQRSKDYKDFFNCIAKYCRNWWD